MTLSFIGLGAMGYPMAGHLAARGHAVAVYNRTAAVAARHAAEHGSRALGSLAEAAAAEAVFTCLPTSREVDEVAAKLAPHLAPGRVWVDCTSGDPDTARGTAARLAERGVAYLDAPVSGGTNGARDGTLTVMAGGDAAALARVRDAIGAYAGKVVHVGPVGAGHALKAINNTLLAIHILAAAEGIYALEQNGIAIATALEVLNASSGRSNVTERLLPKPLESGEFPVTFKLGLLAKDVGIGAAVARAAGIPAPLVEQAAATLLRARADLGADVDYLELVKMVRAGLPGSSTPKAAGPLL